jgi:hypothetical protein
LFRHLERFACFVDTRLERFFHKLQVTGTRCVGVQTISP